MDIKTWSWKRKSGSDRTASATNNKDHTEEAAPRWQHEDEKIKELSSRLSTALVDANSKDAAVKQHARVAEEAISGWEKAGAETEAIKRQLAEVLKEKAVLQDKLAQSEVALKDCTRQVRLVREEQEHKRQELLQKKHKELEKFRADFEAKLADVGRQLLEAGAENKVMAMAMQEHLRTIAELNDLKSRAEADNQVLQQHIQAAEKDKATLKYEVHVLNKEIQIRNEERQYSRRDMEGANRQHIEDTKKMNRLEAECQKLRSLVRRKLPGPNALAQMKMEADNLGSRGRSIDLAHYRHNNGNREVELLLERLLSMEEETKMLKEALAQRNEELNSSRLMCVKASSKLSAMEAYFDSVSPTVAAKAKLNGTSEDEVNCADAWASALVAELSQFKKEKVFTNENGFQTPGPLSDVMDDFAEMERLASSDKSGCETPSSVNKSTMKDEDQVTEDSPPARKNLDSVLAAASQENVVVEDKEEDQKGQAVEGGMSLGERAALLVEALVKAARIEQSSEVEASVQKLRLLDTTDPSPESVVELIKQLHVALNTIAPGNNKLDLDVETQTAELETMRIEKTALEAHVKAEMTRMTSIEKEMGQLRRDKDSLEAAAQATGLELSDAHKLIDELRSKLEGNKEEAMVVREVEAQAQARSASGTLIQDVVTSLEKELEEEYKDDVEAEAVGTEEHQVVDGSDLKLLRKDQEIAEAGEKLAECQRTILALGEQLKALSSFDNGTKAQPLDTEDSLHDRSASEEQTNNTCRELALISSPRSPSEQHPDSSKHSRMFEELGLNSPIDLGSPVASAATTPKNKISKRPSISRFFNRGRNQ